MCKLWKKGIMIAMAAAMTAFFTSCGSKNSTAERGAAMKAQDVGGKLNVAIWDNGQKAGLEEILSEFTKETGILADLQVIAWDSYWMLLEAGASGGDMPDVFWMHSNVATKYMSNGILMDLTDRIAASDVLEMDKFPKDIKEMYQNDGKTYAVPKDIDAIALWYNKDMFDEAGIAYPDDTWTWDDYYQNAVKLTMADKSQYGTAMNPSNNQDGWENIVYSMGGYVISDNMKKSGFGDPKTVKAMEYVEKLVKGAMPPLTVMSETGTDVLLKSGKIAMVPQGSWSVAAMKEDDYASKHCDVAVLPKDAQTGRRVTIYNGLGWAANAQTKNQEAAWKLIEFFGSKAMQLKQAQLGVTMAAYEGVSDDWVKNTSVFHLQPYLDMLNSDLIFRPHSQNTIVWENMMSEKLKEAWSGDKDMKSVCQELEAAMDKLLAEE